MNKKMYALAKKHQEIKVAVGCGWRNYGEEWVHIDGGDYPHIDGDDVFLSNYRENSIDVIFASHLISYFSIDEINKLFIQWFKVLRPTGTLRIATPDLGRIFYLYKEERFDLSSFIGPLYGKMKMKNNIIYHKTGFDFDFLSKTLNLAGFCDVKRYNWRKTDHAHTDDHSQAYLPKMDKDNGILISLNVEAKKIPFTDESYDMRGTKTYRCWNGMLQRASGKTNNKTTSIYTRRGIKVEDYRWFNFNHFLNDMGECPSWGTLDRIDNNKGYYKENCKWSDIKQQARNKSTTRFIEHNGIKKSLSDWSDDTGLSRSAIRGRLLEGWSIKDALEKPLVYKRKK